MAMRKYIVRAGSHLEPDHTDTTYKQEKRQQRERIYNRGEVFESPKNRVRQFGDKFGLVGNETPVTVKPFYGDGSAATEFEDDELPPMQATAAALTEEQLNKMSFPELKAHCDSAGIDLKGITDRKKIIAIILEDQSA